MIRIIFIESWPLRQAFRFTFNGIGYVNAYKIGKLAIKEIKFKIKH